MGRQQLRREIFSGVQLAIRARNSAELSKPEILRPDREFESHLLRQQLSRKALLSGGNDHDDGDDVRQRRERRQE